MNTPNEITEYSKWEAIPEKSGSDNFATSIYADGYKGLLIARCDQNGERPWLSDLIKDAPKNAALLKQAEKLDEFALSIVPPDSGVTFTGDWKQYIAVAISKLKERAERAEAQAETYRQETLRWAAAHQEVEAELAQAKRGLYAQERVLEVGNDQFREASKRIWHLCPECARKHAEHLTHDCTDEAGKKLLDCALEVAAVKAKFGKSFCCQICGADPSIHDTAILERINEKGGEGLWRCREHLPPPSQAGKETR